MQVNVVYHIDQAHTYEATWHGIESAALFNKYKEDNSNFLHLQSPKHLDKDSFTQLANNFCVLYAQNYHPSLEKMFHSLKPIHILRYMIHEDMTVSEYDTPHRQQGAVVEALCWTNGMIYRVRQDAKTNFSLYQYGIYIAPLTATMLGISQ